MKHNNTGAGACLYSAGTRHGDLRNPVVETVGMATRETRLRQQDFSFNLGPYAVREKLQSP